MTQSWYGKNVRFLMLVLGASFAATPWSASLHAQQGVAADRVPDVDVSPVVLTRPVTIQLDHVSLRDAIVALGAAAHVRLQYRTEWVDAVSHSVSLHVTDLSLGSAFDRVLAGTSLQAVALGSNVIGIERVVDSVSLAGGIITGSVTTAQSNQPIAGAKIGLDGRNHVTESDARGRFRIAGVLAGRHTLTARQLGYEKAALTITVADGAEVPAAITLKPSVIALDQVVVTGTVIPTERKAVPNAMTVVTAAELEQRGITHIDQLFRGDIPGLFAQDRGSQASTTPGKVYMASRGATTLDNALSQSIKTYVDGIELADPSYLGLIDPKSVERIEILTGPQASTIYGSNAINGVMQIFTKRGASPRPQVTLHLSTGFIQNNFSSALTPQHDDAVDVSGLEGHMSYNVGGSWVYQGAWSLAHQGTTSGYGGARLQHGPLTADVNGRRAESTTWENGNLSQGGETERVSGVFRTSGGSQERRTIGSTGSTFGATLTYLPTSWWSITTTAGNDVTTSQLSQLAPRYTFGIGPRDSLLFFSQSQTGRRSLSAVSSLRLTGIVAQLTVTSGVDGWNTLSIGTSGALPVLTGSLNGIGVTRGVGHNRGAFVQSQLGLFDQLYLTYGLRAEWNPTFGASATPNHVPRYGIAYAHDVGPLTVKVRGSYGHSTRPPAAGLTNALTLDASPACGAYLADYFGHILCRLANPDLAPESQQGGEGGLELYLGSRASLVVTRYNQTVDNLILYTDIADSVRSLLPATAYGANPADTPYWTDGYWYWYQSQYLNLGGVRNQGWELQGSVNTGPLTTKGTYSWTKSRIMGISPKYRALFAPRYQPGAVFTLLPEHTWALNFTYARGGTTVSANVQGQGVLYYAFEDPLAQDIGARRLRIQAGRMSLPNGYVNRGPGYTRTDVNASHTFSSALDGTLQILNAADQYQNDYAATAAAMGRQTKLGIRWRW